MKKILIVLIILILSGSAVFGQSIESLGYTVVSTGTEDGFTVVTAKDNSGLTFDIYYRGRLSQAQLNLLKEIQSIVVSWRYLTVSDLQYIFSPDQVEIRIIPTSYNYMGRDYTSHLPSGLTFYYTGILEYDFRILVQQMTLRVTGPYFNEDQLADKLKSAVDDPIAYIESHDPEHIARRLVETSNNIEEIKADISNLEDDLKAESRTTDRDIAELRSNAGEIIAEAEAFAEQYETDRAELITRLQEEKETLYQRLDEQEQTLTAKIDELSKTLTGKIDELTEEMNKQIADLTAENQKLTDNYRLLKLGTIAVTYQGIFSTIKEFNKESIEKAIAIKQENSAYTEKDLIEACKAQDIKLSKKEAHIIFMVYFNEF